MIGAERSVNDNLRPVAALRTWARVHQPQVSAVVVSPAMQRDLQIEAGQERESG